MSFLLGIYFSSVWLWVYESTRENVIDRLWTEIQGFPIPNDKIDGLVKSQEFAFSVIPAKAGIQ